MAHDTQFVQGRLAIEKNDIVILEMSLNDIPKLEIPGYILSVAELQRL